MNECLIELNIFLVNKEVFKIFYYHKYMETKINSDDYPSGFGKNYTVNMHKLVTLIKSIFSANYNYHYPQVLEYDEIDGL